MHITDAEIDVLRTFVSWPAASVAVTLIAADVYLFVKRKKERQR